MRHPSRTQANMKKRVLCPMVTGFEELELVAPVDLLRRAGAEVVLAALRSGEVTVGRSNLGIRHDTFLERVDPAGFDLLLLPGGPGVKALRSDRQIANLVRSFVDNGKKVGAICAAPLILKDAGVLMRRRFTAHFSAQLELPDALVQEKVVRDGPVITSRGAGTAVEFGLALVEELFGEGAAAEVAKAIMY